MYGCGCSSATTKEHTPAKTRGASATTRRTSCTQAWSQICRANGRPCHQSDRHHGKDGRQTWRGRRRDRPQTPRGTSGKQEEQSQLTGLRVKRKHKQHRNLNHGSTKPILNQSRRVCPAVSIAREVLTLQSPHAQTAGARQEHVRTASARLLGALGSARVQVDVERADNPQAQDDVRAKAPPAKRPRVINLPGRSR